MIPYDVFSRFYDRMMEEVDYWARAAYYASLMRRHGAPGRLVLDLACGTGKLSGALAAGGFDVIGADGSPGMLSVAAQKYGPEGAVFICQDMRKLDLYGTIDAAVCHLDGINHLLKPQDVRQTFGRVSLFLNPGGLFFFDLNTPRKLSETLGNNTFVYDYDDLTCVWQNSYHESRRICRFDLTFFEKTGGLYRRHDESFAERAYTGRQIRSWLAEAGLALVGEYEEFSFGDVSAESQRITYAAKKEG